MARPEGTRSHVGYIVAVMVAAVVALLLPTSPAQSFHTNEVTAVAARAYGVSASVPPLLAVPPGPDVSLSTPLCPANISDTILGVDLPGVLVTGVIEARVYCPALPAPLSSFLLPLAQADTANAVLLPGTLGITQDLLSVQAVHAECSAGPVGPVGRSTIATLNINGAPAAVDLANLQPNTTISLPLLGLTVVLNEQFFVGGTLMVNGVHVTTSAPILGIGPIDLVISHAECSQTLAPVPDSTIPTTPTTTPTTLPCDGPCPTTPTTLPCNGPCPTTPTTTPTTLPCNGPCPTLPPGFTTTTAFNPLGGVLPGLPPGGGSGVGPGVTPTVIVPFVPQTVVLPGGVLARTGANAWNLLMLAVAALVVGMFLRRASQQSPLSPMEPVPAMRQALSRLTQPPRRKSW